MKTTLDLPDELMRAAKIRAARQGKKLKDVMADLVRRGLADEHGRRSTGLSQRVKLPIVECLHDAQADEEMTPSRVAALLARDDYEAVRS